MPRRTGISGPCLWITMLLVAGKAAAARIQTTTAMLQPRRRPTDACLTAEGGILLYQNNIFVCFFT